MVRIQGEGLAEGCDRFFVPTHEDLHRTQIGEVGALGSSPDQVLIKGLGPLQIAEQELDLGLFLQRPEIARGH